MHYLTTSIKSNLKEPVWAFRTHQSICLQGVVENIKELGQDGRLPSRDSKSGSLENKHRNKLTRAQSKSSPCSFPQSQNPAAKLQKPLQ
jgi:hypothetical protein